MTLKEFLSNPSGKGDTALNTKALATMLDGKYETLLKKKESLIKSTIYKVLGKEVYYIHLIIPTETERDNSYDVVIQLSDLDKKHKGDLSIVNYDARFFSNAPSFAYTYAKVYKDNDLLVHNLENKFDAQQITDNPDTRNRYGIVGYDKYLYFGAKYIVESRMLTKVTLGYRSIRFTNIVFNSKIRSVEKIMQEYRRAERDLKAKKKPSSKQAKQKENEKLLKGDVGIYHTKQIDPIAPKSKIEGSKNTSVKKIKKK